MKIAHYFSNQATIYCILLLIVTFCKIYYIKFSFFIIHLTLIFIGASWCKKKNIICHCICVYNKVYITKHWATAGNLVFCMFSTVKSGSNGFKNGSRFLMSSIPLLDPWRTSSWERWCQDDFNDKVKTSMESGEKTDRGSEVRGLRYEQVHLDQALGKPRQISILHVFYSHRPQIRLRSCLRTAIFKLA